MSHLEKAISSLEAVNNRCLQAVDAMIFSGGALDQHLQPVMVYIDALEAKVRELAGKLDQLEEKQP